MARWVGLTGKMGAGKDHFYKEMKKWAKETFQRVSLADLLRREVEAALIVGSDTWELPVLWSKPYSDDIRRLLQWWGTDLRRNQDPDYWVKKGEDWGRDTAEHGLIPVFTDVRFPNEANMVRENGGIIVRVSAPDDVREARLGMVPPSHESETAMDDYRMDFEVVSTDDNRLYWEQVREVVVASTFEYELFLGRFFDG